MVHIVITGGAGFLGARLARELLKSSELDIAGAGSRPLTRLTLIDQAPVPADLAADSRVTSVVTDLAEAGEGAGSRRSPFGEADVVFHLAAAVSGECEADFDLGMRANVRGTQALFAACRALGTSPVVVYASSLAVFGKPDDQPPPHGQAVDDYTLPTPQTSYGTQKVMGEYLLADYTRKGFLRGRALRLVTVSVRPGKPNAAASGFMSGIIREPLAGERAVCPVDPATEVALASPARAVSGLIRAATATDDEWGGRTAVNLPALTVTVAEMAAALRRVAGPAAAELIDWMPDPGIARIVTSWPARVASARAQRLGLTPDPDFDSIIRAYIADAALLSQRRVMSRNIDNYPLAGHRDARDLEPDGQVRHVDGVVRQRPDHGQREPVNALQPDADLRWPGPRDLGGRGEGTSGDLGDVRPGRRVRRDRHPLRACRARQRRERDQPRAGDRVDGRAVEGRVDVHAARGGVDACDVELSLPHVARAQVYGAHVALGDLREEREALDAHAGLDGEALGLDLASNRVLRVGPRDLVGDDEDNREHDQRHSERDPAAAAASAPLTRPPVLRLRLVGVCAH
jgi:nucleoside-diphosphate-sugar epimerase